MPRFVVQEHDASHLHWDLRLDIDGVGKSWAVPKGPPLKLGIRRLAIQVQDHPLSWFKFEGVIEEGYGAGTVKIWDKGTYTLLKREKNKILIRIRGKKMKGIYRMTCFQPKHWLLQKLEEEVVK